MIIPSAVEEEQEEEGEALAAVTPHHDGRVTLVWPLTPDLLLLLSEVAEVVVLVVASVVALEATAAVAAAPVVQGTTGLFVMLVAAAGRATLRRRPSHSQGMEQLQRHRQ